MAPRNPINYCKFAARIIANLGALATFFALGAYVGKPEAYDHSMENTGSWEPGRPINGLLDLKQQADSWRSKHGPHPPPMLFYKPRDASPGSFDISGGKLRDRASGHEVILGAEEGGRLSLTLPLVGESDCFDLARQLIWAAQPRINHGQWISSVEFGNKTLKLPPIATAAKAVDSDGESPGEKDEEAIGKLCRLDGITHAPMTIHGI